jgi:hypothetical protein
MEVRVNDLLVIEGEITEPKSGPWTARLEIDDEETELAGVVTITSGGVSFTGVASGAVEQGRYIARVIGGNSGLKKELTAKHYYQTSLKVVLDDLMRESGEVFDAVNSEPLVTAFIVSRWARLRAETRLALQQVAKEVDGFWRVTRDGKVLIRKSEVWTVLTDDYVEISRDPSSSVVEIAPEDAPFARPGTQLGNDKITEVITHWRSGEMRQRLVLDTGVKVRGTAAQFADAMRRANQAPIDYSQWYPAKVVAQDGSGTIQIYADDERVRGNGITHVPMRHGVPGVTVQVVPGQRVILFFEDGNPKKPAAALWPDGSSVLSVALEAKQQLVFVAPQLFYGAANAAQRAMLGDLFKTWCDTLTVDTAMGPAPLSAASKATIETFLSTKHKLDG